MTCLKVYKNLDYHVIYTMFGYGVWWLTQFGIKWEAFLYCSLIGSLFGEKGGSMSAH
jgi:hypothetical protein